MTCTVGTIELKISRRQNRAVDDAGLQVVGQVHGAAKGAADKSWTSYLLFVRLAISAPKRSPTSYDVPFIVSAVANFSVMGAARARLLMAASIPAPIAARRVMDG